MDDEPYVSNIAVKEQFFNNIFQTTPLSSLREEQHPVKIRVYKSKTDIKDIVWDGAYPFFTIEDVKAFVYTYFFQRERSESAIWYPKNTFIGFEVEPNKFQCADFVWFNSGINEDNTPLILNNPYDSVRGSSLDERFVDNTGNLRPLGITRRGRSTLEDVFHTNIPIFHIFNLKSLLSSFKGQRPISLPDWNSKFAPYFPDIPAEGPYDIDEDDIKHGKTLALYTLKRDSLLHSLDEFLESTSLIKLSLFGIRGLRIVWTKNEASEPASQVEELFYKIPATGRRPFMRLMPAESGAISKLHTMGSIPIPDIADPSLLLQWSREHTPTPNKDVLLAKSLLRGPIGSVPAIYGTLRIFEDGTADYILYPPRIVKKLDIASDLRNIAPVISQTITGTHLNSYSMNLAEISVILSLRLQKEDPVLTKAKLQKRLRALQPFFHEISPLPDESPLIMLRYKAVSEFAKEDKIHSFISQYVSRKSVSSSSFLKELSQVVVEEFNMDPKDVKKKIEQWVEKREDFTTTAPELGEFVETYNPGIDIAIFGAHPFYTIHCYRISSSRTLARLYTLLSVLLTADDESLDYFVKESITTGLDSITDKIEQERLFREDTGDEHAAAQAVLQQQPEKTGISEFKQKTELSTFLSDFMFDEVDTAEVPNSISALPPAAPTGVPAPNTAVAAAMKKGLPVPPDAPVLAKGWFINKLKEIDPRLFSYKTTVKGDNGYARQCAANEDRQPSVITHAQYMHMRDVYAEDEDVFFVVYPFEGREKEPPAKSEVYRLLKFGSDPANPAYYFCPTLFCLRDEIMLRPRDFKSRTDRDGNPKEKNTCPFCHGRLIDDELRNKKSKTATVILRKDKPKADIKHTEIGFLKTKSHPEGFSLPCCFTKAKTLRIKDPQFAAFRDYAVEASAINDKDEDGEEEVEEEQLTTLTAVEYGVQLSRIYREYILGAEKHPIEPGKFGILTTGLDTYFSQNSNDIVGRTGIRQELTPTAEGFIRMGVQYTANRDELIINPTTPIKTYFNEGLIGALVPLLMKNTIDELRALLIKEFNPRIFVAANYGNLVLEFYNENEPLPTDNELRLWASRELDVSLLDRNIYALQRIYIAYKRFIAFLNNPTQRKELRHISSVLAQPGIITSRGLILIVLEHDIKTPESTSKIPIVKCPPYGISPELYDTADVAFLMKDTQGIYTPLVYTANRPGRGKYLEEHSSTIRFQAATRPAWPQIVQQRVEEFFKTCSSNGRSIYTSSSFINSSSLAPVSKVIATLKSVKSPVGIVRDSYNHIVGVTYRVLEGKGLAVLPVIDDGSMPVQIRIHLDWEDIALASIDDVLHIYSTLIVPTFSFYKGYKPIHVVRHSIEKQYIGIQLENGMIIPTKPTVELGAAARLLRVIEIAEFEWDVNRKIIMSGTARDIQQIPGYASTSKQLEELYQHFRISVAHWLAGPETGELRKKIEDVIFRSDLPGYEKRKRLEFLINTVFINWFFEDEEAFELPPTFLRSDCRQITQQDKCTGACSWKQNEGQCKIHIPKTSTFDNRTVSTLQLFTGRIIEELSNFYERRQQLLKNSVSRLSGLAGAIQYDNQWIIPEKSVTWIELLRLDWSTGGEPVESARFYEEKSQQSVNTTHISDALFNIPLSIAVLLDIPSDKVPLLPYKVYLPEIGSTQHPLQIFMPILSITFDELGITSDTRTFTTEILDKYSKITHKTIIFIKNNGDILVGRGSLRPSEVYIFIEIDAIIGMLVYDMTHIPLKINELPMKLINAIRTASISTVQKTVAPIIAAPPTRRLTIVRK